MIIIWINEWMNEWIPFDLKIKTKNMIFYDFFILCVCFYLKKKIDKYWNICVMVILNKRERKKIKKEKLTIKWIERKKMFKKNVNKKIWRLIKKNLEN